LIQPDETQTLRIYDAEDNTQWPDWLHQKMADKKRRDSKVRSAELKPA
jgi:all-trans-retinol 13,14-reductase